ncbi:Type II secretion system protein G precursor [compost metagenome]
MNRRGFTLLEIMIVVAILGALVAFAAPRLFKKDNSNVRTVARSFIVLSKTIRDKARLTNSTYRLVINMDESANTYWVERANGPMLLDPNEAEKEKEREQDKDNAPPAAFQVDKSIFKKEKTLPGILRFGSLETINSKAPMSAGTGYIYFFPEGLVEASALQITNGTNLTWTLVFNPLTGQADIVPKAQSLKDIQR